MSASHNFKNTSSINRRETFAFVTLVIILLIVSITTIITNLVIIYKLRLIPGFQFFDFTSNNAIFHKDTFIDRILLTKNKIVGLSQINGDIELKSGHTSMHVNHDGIDISSFQGFEVRSPKTNKLLFPFDFSSVPLTSIKTLSVPGGIRDVKMIRSPIEDDLNIVASERIRIRGNKGIRVEGKRIDIQADNIFLSSANSSIILETHQGIYLNMNMFKDHIINRELPTSSTINTPKTQYKLCVCAKNGRLFRISSKNQSSSCADARFPQSENPCI
ncbi:hypothetical protein RDWZM_004078 [Blomia tropicalis]|uniref:Beta-sarcoglycan n=1 Tax=Blomia tropicalis TaxID=40697 RepID=A0A9Q0RRG7_BLOTA|nr:hypothetical protein RDWZM_004078 [Blomia tropicalis]